MRRIGSALPAFPESPNNFLFARTVPDLHNGISPALLRPFSTALFSAANNAVLAEGETAPVLRDGWNDRRSPQLLM